MGQNGLSLVFTPDSSSGSGATDFIKDAISDITLQPTNNSNLTSSASTNPLGYSFNDTDQVLYGAKTLFFKDFKLLSDSSKWVNSKPTYEVSLSEDWPNAKIYAAGNINADSQAVYFGLRLQDVGDLIGVSGINRRLAWLVIPTTSTATATGQLSTDGSNTTTINFANAIIGTTANSGSPTWASFLHQSSNETNDIHDFRLSALQNNNLTVVGVIVYSENSGNNIQFRPGSTYINKTKFTSSTGATASQIAFGHSGGGNVLFYKTSAGYTQSISGHTVAVSTAQGSSGTNILNVATGTGSSFPVGTAITVPQGTSHYFGVVKSISTDALTVAPTLSFGISNSIYSVWKSVPTLAVSATYMTKVASIDFSDLVPTVSGQTFILGYHESNGKFAYWSANTNWTTVDKKIGLQFLGGSGFLQIDGKFSAVEIELNGQSGAICHYIAGVDGVTTYSINQGLTGTVKHTILTDGNPSWHNCVIAVGASMGTAVSINRVNLYDLAPVNGVTYGSLARVHVNQAEIPRTSSLSATMAAIGTQRRFYAGDLFITPSSTWSTNQGYTSAGGIFSVGSSGGILSHKYYGKDFAIIGTAGGGTLTLDGIGMPLTFNAIQGATFEGFHTVQYTVGSGATAIIQAIDVVSSQGSLMNLSNYYLDSSIAIPVKKKDKIVKAHYTTTAGQILPHQVQTVINYEYKLLDTHGIVNVGSGANWACVIPKTGKYSIVVKLMMSGSTGWSEIEGLLFNLLLNGNYYARHGYILGLDSSGGSVEQSISGSYVGHYRKGDVLQVEGFQNSGGTLNVNTVFAQSFFMIEEIVEEV